jgi:hypothetical protein
MSTPMSNRYDDLILHLKLDDIDISTKTETTPDSSKSRCKAIVQGASLVADDTFGACLNLDGQDDYVEVSTLGLWGQVWKSLDSGSSPTLIYDPPHTIEGWIKVEAYTGAWMLRLGGEPGSDPMSRALLWMLIPDEVLVMLVPWVQLHLPVPLGEWVHIATSYDGNGNFVGYLNGHPLVNLGVPFFNPTEMRLTLAKSFGPEKSFQGKMAHVRLYQRALSMEEIREDMETDRLALPEYRRGHPIGFSLSDKDENYVLYIGDDPSDHHHLNLELRNTSSEVISFQKQGATASSANHHFELVFRNGVLSDKTLKMLRENKDKDKIVPEKDADVWDVSAGEDNRSGTLSIYFLYKDTSKPFDPGQRLIVPLRKISANAGAGARGTRIELKLKQLTYVGETTLITGSRIQHLHIISHLGSQRLPLHVSFVGSNRILNDGVSANTLVLQLMNVIKSEGDTSVTLKKETEFLISFDVESGNEVAPWSLCTEEEIKGLKQNDIIVAKIDQDNNVEVDGRGNPVPDTGMWNVARTDRRQGFGSPVWSLSPKQDIVLKHDQYILVYISNIITSLPSGLTNLYLNYQKIPGFWDGQVVCPIEKAPLLFYDVKDQQGKYTGELRVGIGCVKPQAKLEIVTGPKDGGTKPLVIRNDKGRLMLREDGILQVDSQSQGPDAGIAIAQNSGVDLLLHASADGAYLGTKSNHRLVLKTDNQNRVVVAADGKILVGSGSSSIAADRVNAVVASGSPAAGIAIAQNSGVNVLLQASVAGGYIGTTSNHRLVLGTSNKDTVEIQTDGRVGIEGGLHVGGKSDPGSQNLLVEGAASIKAGLTVGDPRVAASGGGLSVGGSLYIKETGTFIGSLSVGDSISVQHWVAKDKIFAATIEVKQALVFKTYDGQYHDRLTVHPPGSKEPTLTVHPPTVHPTGGTAPALNVAGYICEKLDIISSPDNDWSDSNGPIMKYFRARLKGRPKGTMLRVISDKPGWAGHFWQGWVDHNEDIPVIPILYQAHYALQKGVVYAD